MTNLQKLQNIAEEYRILPFVWSVLTDPCFASWSGSGSEKHHHYGDGGLCEHTREVVEFCIANADVHNYYTGFSPDRVNMKELLIAAIWHDYGKIWDYQIVDGVWGKHDNHARRVCHVSRSALEFEKWFDYHLADYERMQVNEENILHSILAHHGSREWGSPVSPATKEAWILHLSDMMSARLDDCGRYDKF